MINQGLNEMVAISRLQDNERKIAAAELRRLAKAACHAERSSAPSNRAIAARLPRMPAIGSVAGVWRWFGRGLVAVVGRRVPA